MSLALKVILHNYIIDGVFILPVFTVCRHRVLARTSLYSFVLRGNLLISRRHRLASWTLELWEILWTVRSTASRNQWIHSWIDQRARSLLLSVWVRFKVAHACNWSYVVRKTVPYMIHDRRSAISVNTVCSRYYDSSRGGHLLTTYPFKLCSKLSSVAQAGLRR